MQLRRISQGLSGPLSAAPGRVCVFHPMFGPATGSHGNSLEHRRPGLGSGRKLVPRARGTNFRTNPSLAGRFWGDSPGRPTVSVRSAPQRAPDRAPEGARKRRPPHRSQANCRAACTGAFKLPSRPPTFRCSLGWPCFGPGSVRSASMGRAHLVRAHRHVVRPSAPTGHARRVPPDIVDCVFHASRTTRQPFLLT